MVVLRSVLIGIFAVVVGTAAFWGLLLFLDPVKGLVAWFAVALVLGSFAIRALVNLMKKRNFELRKHAGLLTIFLSSLSLVALTVLLYGVNFLLYDVEEDLTEKTELTVEEKLAYYRYMLTREDGNVDVEQLEKAESSGITFYYEKGTDPSKAIDEIKVFVKDYQKQFEESLGGKTEASVSFVLYGESMKMPERESVNKEHVGFYNENSRTIHIPLPIDKTVLAHEYAHHLFLNIARERGLYTSEIPAWFTEGVATYLSEKEKSLPFMPVEETRYVDFQKISRVGGWENHLNSPADPYFQSRSFIGYLADREGQDIISRIFSEMSDAEFELGFEEATGKTLGEYEARFFADFKKLPVLWNEAHLLDAKDNDYEKSLEKFLAIAEIVPTLELVNHRIANLNMETGDFEKAVVYRTKQLNLKQAENGNNLAASYGNLAGSLLFTDIREAVKAAEMAVEVSTEDEVSWNKGILNELMSLEKHIEHGDPFKGYMEILNGQYTINNNGGNYGQKIALIDIALEKYSQDGSADRDKLIQLRKSLESQITAKK